MKPGLRCGGASRDQGPQTRRLPYRRFHIAMLPVDVPALRHRRHPNGAIGVWLGASNGHWAAFNTSFKVNTCTPTIRFRFAQLPVSLCFFALLPRFRSAKIALRAPAFALPPSRATTQQSEIFFCTANASGGVLCPVLVCGTFLGPSTSEVDSGQLTVD